MRRFAQALVLVAAFLILVAEVQRGEDAEAMRAAYQMYGDGEPRPSSSCASRTRATNRWPARCSPSWSRPTR